MMTTYKHSAPDSTIDIVITPNDKGSPVGKLGDVELRFTAGPLSGFRLVGFAVWERRNGTGRNVTMPSRQYSVNGERRSYALLRPTMNDSSDESVTRHLVDLILSAFTAYEAAEATGEASPATEAAHVR